MVSMAGYLMLLEGEGCGLLVILGLIYAAIQVILVVLKYIVGAALSIAAAVAGVTAAAGLVVGLFYAFKCFFMAWFEVKDVRKEWAKKVILKPGEPARRKPSGALEFYETYVTPEYSSYFRGVFQKELGKLIAANFSNVTDTIEECWDNVGMQDGFVKVLSFIKNLITTLLLLAGALIIAATLGLLIVVVTAVSMLFYWIFYGVVLAGDRIYYAVHKIETRCVNLKCGAKSEIPVFCCPKCGTPHQNLRPGAWGVLHRKCACGELLPCTVKGKSKPGKYTKEDFRAFCPQCGQPVPRHSHPLGVALVGGVNAGKTTFKTAFLYKFINELSTKHEVDIEMLDDATEQEFGEIQKYFRGVRMVPETRPDPVRGYDVTVFTFYMRHAKFDATRTVQVYDMPGEVFENQNSQNKMVHFQYIEGLVFLLDPYSLQAVVGETDDNGTMRIGTMDFNLLADRLVNELKDVPKTKMRGGKYTIPVAVCINKVDTPELKNKIGMPAAKKLMKNHPDQFKTEFDAIDYLCRAFLNVNDLGNVMMTLDNTFTTVHYFSCSSMGYVPKHTLARFVPENVTAAVNWLFSRQDKQFDKVFDEYSISDISEAQKELGRTNRDYYDELISESTAASAAAKS